MHFEQVDGSRILAILRQQGIPSSEVAVFKTIPGHMVIHAMEDTPHGKLRHVSISFPTRYPTWDEIKDAKYHFFKDDEDAMMLLPRKTDNVRYVNLHPNCFHLWQLPVIPGPSGKWELE
jgi:hypothetical protein